MSRVAFRARPASLIALLVGGLAAGCGARERPDDSCAAFDDAPDACPRETDRVGEACTYVRTGPECGGAGLAERFGCFGSEFVDCEGDADCPTGYFCEQIDVPERCRSIPNGIECGGCWTTERGVCFAE